MKLKYILILLILFNSFLFADHFEKQIVIKVKIIDQMQTGKELQSILFETLGEFSYNTLVDSRILSNLKKQKNEVLLDRSSSKFELDRIFLLQFE
jgi:hypothetical protein